MSWRSGELIVTQGSRRNAKLFVAHLEELRCRFRHYKKVHVICDNARFHTIEGSRMPSIFAHRQQAVPLHGHRGAKHGGQTDLGRWDELHNGSGGQGSEAAD